MNLARHFRRSARRQARAAGRLLALMAELAEDLVEHQRAQAGAGARPLPTATELPPCSDKVAILAARWAAGEALFHPADGRVAEGEGHRVRRVLGGTVKHLGRVQLQGAQGAADPENEERPAMEQSSAGRSR